MAGLYPCPLPRLWCFHLSQILAGLPVEWLAFEGDETAIAKGRLHGGKMLAGYQPRTIRMN